MEVLILKELKVITVQEDCILTVLLKQTLKSYRYSKYGQCAYISFKSKKLLFCNSFSIFWEKTIVLTLYQKIKINFMGNAMG